MTFTFETKSHARLAAMLDASRGAHVLYRAKGDADAYTARIVGTDGACLILQPTPGPMRTESIAFERIAYLQIA